jgi:CRISPR-associated endoribonuclease Cas6
LVLEKLGSDNKKDITNEIIQFKFSFSMDNEDKINTFSGRIAYGAILGFIKKYDEDLSQYLHEGREKRSYSVNGIKNEKIGNVKTNIQSILLTTTDHKLTQGIIRILSNNEINSIIINDSQVKLLNIDVLVKKIEEEENLKIGDQIRLRFNSPVIFASNKRKAKTDPYPHLNTLYTQIIKLYSRIVQELTPKEIEELVSKYMENIATPSFNLQSKHITLGHKVKVTGFVGTILLIIEDNSGLDFFLPMIKLANLWGLGGKTTMGFGQITYQHKTFDNSKNNQKGEVKE